MSHWFQTEMFGMELLPHLRQAVFVQGYSTLQDAYNIAIKAEKPTHNNNHNLLLQSVTQIKNECQQQEEAPLLWAPTVEEPKDPTNTDLIEDPAKTE